MGSGGLTSPSPMLAGANQDYQAWRDWQQQNMASHPDLAKVLEHINNAIQIGGLGLTIPWLRGPASEWPRTAESANRIMTPVQKPPDILDVFLSRRLGDVQSTPGGPQMTSDDLKHILELLGMR